MGDHEGAPPGLALDVIMYVTTIEFVSHDILDHAMGESSTIDPPLSFDMLMGFVTRPDNHHLDDKYYFDYD